MATPSRVSVCDALTVDGGDTRGGGGRPLTFSWSAKGSTQGLTDRVSALLAPQKALPTANFDAKDLDAGTYNFTLTATNFLGQTSARWATVERSELPIPTIEIEGESTRSVMLSVKAVQVDIMLTLG